MLTDGVDKFKFSILESIILFVEGLLLIFQGYLPWAWDTAATLAIYAGVISNDSSALFTEVTITFIFILILSTHDIIIDLPFSLFKTFVVEQNHGFNKSTVGLFFYDKVWSII
jgi:STE24 endopeptidase